MGGAMYMDPSEVAVQHGALAIDAVDYMALRISANWTKTMSLIR